MASLVQRKVQQEKISPAQRQALATLKDKLKYPSDDPLSTTGVKLVTKWNRMTLPYKDTNIAQLMKRGFPEVLAEAIVKEVDEITKVLTPPGRGCQRLFGEVRARHPGPRSVPRGG